ncbi:MAG TPA: pitrilysin family protein [Chitinophagaceae bacterium]|nr:pitrilysin family protein [Chitinophagaceae bacterium]
MKKISITLALLAFVIMGANGQQQKITFTKYTLPNGLKVILHQDTTAPVVAVTVLYHVGSKNEKPGQSGFAHFFEHLMFEGSKYIGRGQYMKYVSNAGGQLNANTSQDRTFYYENLPSNQLKLGLWLESERMMHGKIEQVGVNTQREVVKEEKRMRVDNRPYGTILTEVCKRLFNGTPYAWVPIGTMADLNKAKLQDFLDFYHTYYVPGNAVLSIAGDINLDSTKKLISAYFGPIPRGEKPISRPQIHLAPLGALANRVDTVYDNIQLPAVIEAYRGPVQGTPDYYAFNVLSNILSGSASSRMQKDLVDKDQLAIQVESFPMSMESVGAFINLGIVNSGITVQALRTAMDKEVDRIKKTTVGAHEFQKVMNQIETDYIGSFSTQLGIAEKLSNYEVYFGNANLINTELSRYKKVTPEDVKRVADKYLNDQDRIILYYLPKSAEKKG